MAAAHASATEEVSVWGQIKSFSDETTLHGIAHVTADKRHISERYFIPFTH
jgi:hypothetical protein